MSLKNVPIKDISCELLSGHVDGFHSRIISHLCWDIWRFLYHHWFTVNILNASSLFFFLSCSHPCLMGRSHTGTTFLASGSEQQLSPLLILAGFLTSAGRTRRRSKRPLKVVERQEVSTQLLAFDLNLNVLLKYQYVQSQCAFMEIIEQIINWFNAYYWLTFLSCRERGPEGWS